MLSAQCSMLDAQCSMLNALGTHISLGSLDSSEGSRSSLTNVYWQKQLALYNGVYVHSQTNTFPNTNTCNECTSDCAGHDAGWLPEPAPPGLSDGKRRCLLCTGRCTPGCYGRHGCPGSTCLQVPHQRWPKSPHGLPSLLALALLLSSQAQ